jgi:hypothetical protein
MPRTGIFLHYQDSVKLRVFPQTLEDGDRSGVHQADMGNPWGGNWQSDKGG